MIGRFHLGWNRERRRSPVFGPDYHVLSPLRIIGSYIGAVIALGLALLLWVALPETQLFFAGVLVVGTIIGFLLFWKHR